MLVVRAGVTVFLSSVFVMNPSTVSTPKLQGWISIDKKSLSTSFQSVLRGIARVLRAEGARVGHRRASEASEDQVGGDRHAQHQVG